MSIGEQIKTPYVTEQQTLWKWTLVVGLDRKLIVMKMQSPFLENVMNSQRIVWEPGTRDMCHLTVNPPRLIK